MNDFKEWLWEDEFKSLVRDLVECCVIHDVNEALRLRLPGDPAKAKERLVNHLKHHFKGPAQITFAAVISGIRHIFTNYDEEWRAYEKTKTNSDDPVPVAFVHPITNQSTNFDLGDPNDHLRYWNTLVAAVADLVAYIIDAIGLDPKHRANYLKANQQWLQTKMR